MQLATVAAIILTAFMGLAIFVKLAHHILAIMVNPPAYYEPRDWFDAEDRMTIDPFDSIPITKLDRIDYEEDFE